MDEKKSQDLANKMLKAVGQAPFLEALGAAVLVLCHIAKQAPAEHAAEVAKTVHASVMANLSA